MNGTIARWTPELERSFKEVLFRFLEEVQSTKAALYLEAGDGSFVLATHYGFRGRDLLATSHLGADPLVVRLRQEAGQPMVVNDVAAAPDLASYLHGAGTSRLMAVPIVAGERLIGFVDARDKGRSRIFEASDRGKARAIAAALLDLISRSHLYPDVSGAAAPPPVAPVALPEPLAPSASEVVAAAPSAPPAPVARAAAPPAPATVVLTPVEDVPTVTAAVDRAGLARVVEEAGAVLHQQGVAAVALTVVDDTTAATVLLVGDASAAVDEGAVVSHQLDCLREAGAAEPAAATWRVETCRHPGCGDQTPGRVVASALLVGSQGWSLVGSVVAALGRPAAAVGLRCLQAVAADRAAVVAARLARRALARRLLEPGARELTELRSHSLAVSQLAWAIAGRLGLDEVTVEEAALAGLLHDVGMRELRYDELYRAANPSNEERLEYRRHVELGEQIVSGTGLDRVAQAVRHHHERWDGKGYPDRLAGEAIPFLARLVHVAEVYDVLTSPTSYRRPLPADKALSILKTAAGHQFDPQLVDALARAVE